MVLAFIFKQRVRQAYRREIWVFQILSRVMLQMLRLLLDVLTYQRTH